MVPEKGFPVSISYSTMRRIEVGAAIDRARAGGLLRGHVRWRPDHKPGRRLPGAASGVEHPRDAEVGDDRPPAIEQDVFGLDVAMNDGLAVRVAERLSTPRARRTASETGN